MINFGISSEAKKRALRLDLIYLLNILWSSLRTLHSQRCVNQQPDLNDSST